MDSVVHKGERLNKKRWPSKITIQINDTPRVNMMSPFKTSGPRRSQANIC
jgi:hypothetical protein